MSSPCQPSEPGDFAVHSESFIRAPAEEIVAQEQQLAGRGSPELTTERVGRLVRVAQASLGGPVVALVLTSAGRHWLHANHRLLPAEEGQILDFCESMAADDVDADAPRGRVETLVQHGASPFPVLSGCPLYSKERTRIGTLCVVDRVARTLSAAQLQSLDDLASLAEQTLEAEVADHRFLTLAATVPVGVFETDAAGACLFTNQAWQRIAGLDHSEAAGHGWAQAIHPDDREFVANAWTRSAKESTTFESTFRFCRPCGETRWVRVKARPLRAPNGDVSGWVGVDEDITDTLKLEYEVRQRDELFRRLAEASEEVFWITDIKTHEVLFVSPAYETIWQRSVASVIADPKDWVESTHPDDRAAARLAYEGALRGGSGFKVAFRIRRPDGTLRHILSRGFPVHDEHGELVRMAGVAIDMTEMHEARLELVEKAQRDGLTGALHADAFHEVLRHELARARRTEAPLAVAVIDIDRLGRIDEEYGRDVGDDAQRMLVDRLRSRLRASDVVGRLGGGELGVVLPDCNAEDAEGVVKTILADAANAPLPSRSGANFSITTAAGVAETMSGQASVQHVLHLARKALSAAKLCGRNAVVRTSAAKQRCLPHLQKGDEDEIPRTTGA